MSGDLSSSSKPREEATLNQHSWSAPLPGLILHYSNNNNKLEKKQSSNTHNSLISMSPAPR